MQENQENKPNQSHVNQELLTLKDANQKLSDLNSNLEIQLQQTMAKNDE